MKKKVVIFIFLLTLVFLTSCLTLDDDGNNNGDDYKFNDNSEFEPEGKTELLISDLESGSAKITFNELENVSYYSIKVSLDNEFSDNKTVEIVALTNPYTLYFDDNSKLFIKGTAISNNGKEYETSDVKEIKGKYAIFHNGDLFNNQNVSSYETKNAKISSDLHSLIVNPTSDQDLSVKKTFLIDFDEVDFFQIRFIAKNTKSKITVNLNIGNNKTEVTSFDQINRGYIRFDLNDLNLSGEQLVEVEIISSGYNSGFQLDYIKFLSEKEHQEIKNIFNVEYVNLYNEVEKLSNLLTINNDPEPTVETTPQSDVNFDPNELSTLIIDIKDYIPRDTFKLTIYNSNNDELYDSGTMYIQNFGGKFSLNLIDLGITTKDTYTFSYLLNSNKAIIESMQLVGESNLTVDVNKSGWQDGVSAYIDQNNVIRLKENTIYNYGEIRKKMTIDLGETPIIFFDIESLSGAWAVKVIPENASSDIYVIRDNDSDEKKSANLAQILQSHGVTTFTLEIFVIGGSAADQNARLKLNPISFGNLLSIVSNTSDEVISSVSLDIGEINVDDLGYIFININKLSKGAEWRLYLLDKSTNRKYEMKTYLEGKYPQRYNRAKVGQYIYDIKQITELSEVLDLEIIIEVIGNNAVMEINNIDFTSNNNIPTKNNSSY